MEIKLGQVVISKAGRDAKKKFVVIEVIDSSFVRIVDGKLRKIEKPKKKKIKHLEITKEIVEILEKKLYNGEVILDSDIKHALNVQEQSG